MFYVRKSSVLYQQIIIHILRTGTLSSKRVSDYLKESGRGRKSTVQTRRTDCRVVENWAAYTYPDHLLFLRKLSSFLAAWILEVCLDLEFS